MEQILEKLGRPGTYHCLIGMLFAITWWSVTLGNVSMAFYGFTPQHNCSIPELADQNNSSLAVVTSVAADQCSYNITRSNMTESHKCTAWVYDDEGRGTITVSTEFNLVCEKKNQGPISTTVFFVGVFCGALIFGVISDHLGRKKTLAICLYLQIPISLTVAFMPEYYSFTALRFILGVWVQGISTVAFVHCIEFFQQKYRSVVMTAFGMSWAFAQLLAALFAYVFANWRHMQIAAACLALFTLPYFWWLPESPRWLLVKGRYDEIVDIFIRRAATVNKLKVGEMMDYARQQLAETQQQKVLAVEGENTQQSFKNILRTPVLLKRLIGMCYIWCVSSLAYYVFIFNTGDLAGNRYLNFAIGAALEIVVNLIIIVIMMRFGRKRPLLVFASLVAVFCILTGAVPSTCGGRDISWLKTVFASLGKMATAAVMCLIFVYAAELFPTFARGSCLAFCGCSLRIGGMVAPQVLILKNVFTEFPFILVGGLILMAAVYTFFLPETLGRSMPNTIQDAIELQPTNHKPHKDSESQSISSGPAAEENDKLMEVQLSEKC